MSAPSLAPYIIKRPWLQRWLKPLSNWYTNAAGYRQLGLMADDIIPEENDVVQLALKRLPPKEAYDRVFRIRRAFQDIPYLSSIIKEIEVEMKEREDLEAMIVQKRAANAKSGH
ncbi:Cytochrome b-c1 complex subunit 7 [Kalmusia sp. IMI 367209]|nr:Cytochrome b-c1 complex subunit 7 [Kalmusia sp. IMI 367209]